METPQIREESSRRVCSPPAHDSSLSILTAHTLCVYLHRAQDVVFYVGMGTADRPFQRLPRNESWKHYVRQLERYEVEIVYWTNDKRAACREETRLIRQFSPQCNLKDNVNTGTRGRTPRPPPLRTIPPGYGDALQEWPAGKHGNRWLATCQACGWMWFLRQKTLPRQCPECLTGNPLRPNQRMRWRPIVIADDGAILTLQPVAYSPLLLRTAVHTEASA